MNLNDLRSFVQVAELGTLSAAAKTLGVPKSTVSRRISRLEDALAVPLVVRSARSVALTDDGRRLHARSAPLLRELSDVAAELTESRGEPAGRLRLTAPPDLAHTSFLIRLLGLYRARWPKVVVDVTLTNRVVDLVEEGFDVAVRPNATQLRDAKSLMGRRVSTSRSRLWASERYVADRGLPQRPEDLADHDGILHPMLEGAGFPLSEAGTDAAPRFYPVREAVTINDFSLIAELITLDVGIGFIPVATVSGSLDDVVCVLPDHVLPEVSLWLVWPASRHLSPRVRAFVDLAFERGLLPGDTAATALKT